MTRTFRHRSTRVLASALAILTLTVGVAACSKSDSSSPTTTAAGSDTTTAKLCGKKITIGYSAWPGWFPWRIAEKKEFFKANGLDVKMKYFSDYISSLDAMVAGSLDGNSQTLNDTMLGVSTGGKQVIVLTNDNSTGNDAIIVDKSIKTVEDLRGKTVAAEQGVVDHFLLLQGLADHNMTEQDIDFRGVVTDAAAAGFHNGSFDAVGVFAPFTIEALKRPGSHVLFSSKDYPGTISDHLVMTPKFVQDCPADTQALVNTWYQTLDWMKKNPTEATSIMADLAQLSPADYDKLAEGTTIFTPAQALESFQKGNDTKSLEYTANLINPFLVHAGLIPKQVSTDGLLDPTFTKAYVDAHS